MNRTEYLAHAEIAADATGQKQIEALRWMRDTSARALAGLPVPEVERPASGTTIIIGAATRHWFARATEQG